MLSNLILEKSRPIGYYGFNEIWSSDSWYTCWYKNSNWDEGYFCINCTTTINDIHCVAIYP